MMIYELRRYHTGAGRMQDMDEMCGKWVPPIFQRLGVPQAITAWHATSGPKLPAYWWLLAWPDLETRLRGWTAFYNDLIVGEKIPTFMIFLGWRDGASRMAGIRRYQNDRTVLACRAEEHTKVGSDVFCISDRYLFEAASLLPSGQDTSPVFVNDNRGSYAYCVVPEGAPCGRIGASNESTSTY